jgi:hypothetical protein
MSRILKESERVSRAISKNGKTKKTLKSRWGVGCGGLGLGVTPEPPPKVSEPPVRDGFGAGRGRGWRHDPAD